MDRLKSLLPGKRRLIQLYSFLLYNAHLKGFVKGDIFTGLAKSACVPGLNCYSCPGAIGACPLGALQNALTSSGHKMPFYIVGILILYGLIFGRTICGFLCPFGLFQDLLYKIPTFKIRKGRVTRALSSLKYVLLVFLVVLLPLYVPLPAFCKYVCPAGTLEGAVGLLIHPANADKFSMLGTLFSMKFLILIAVITLCIFLFRAFCRFLCPLGAMYSLFNRFSIAGVRVDNAKCVDCGRCVSKCRMDVRNVSDLECIHCGECISSCPTGAISIKAGRITLKGPDAKKQDKQSKRRSVFVKAIALFVLVSSLVYSNFPDKKETLHPSTPENAENTLPIGKDAGMLAPDFSASLYSGKGEITLSDLRGKTVILNFWATWCAPCVKELPYFEEIALKYPDQIYVLALHSNLVTEDVQSYLNKTPYAFSFGIDATGKIIQSFGGSTMLPQTVVIDENGVIVYNAVGSMTIESLEKLAKQTLSS